MIRWKLRFGGEGMITLIGDDVNFCEADFSGGGNEYIFDFWVPEKFWGKGGQSTPRGVNKSKLNERAIYRGNTGSIILLNTVSC